MLNINFSGLDQLEHKLKKLEENAKKIEGLNSIPLSELFPVEFMKKNTHFSSINELFLDSPFNIELEKDFESINEKELDRFITKSSNFDSWLKMQEAAIAHWVEMKLGL